MKILSLSLVLITALLSSNSSFSQENTADIAQLLSTIVEPEPIERVHPKYPIEAARAGREGWAILSFVITEEGRVEDIIVNDSSGSKDFIKESKKAVKKWRYKPAFANGKAIQQCVNSVQMDFKMVENGTTGVSRRFFSRYKKARQALTDKNYEEVEKQLATMKKMQYMHLSESNYMHLLAADYAKEKGYKHKQLKHLNRVAMSLSSFSDEKQKLSVLYQVFNLEVQLNKFQDAHTSYEKMIKLSVAEPYLEQLAKTMSQVNDVIAGDKNLVIAGAIGKEFWYANLVRKEFSLAAVEGSLHTIDVRCANKRHVFTFEEESTWKVPASWGSCSIYVFGEPKTTFKLVEHPLSS